MDPRETWYRHPETGEEVDLSVSKCHVDGVPSWQVNLQPEDSSFVVTSGFDWICITSSPEEANQLWNARKAAIKAAGFVEIR
jgi:hypothetical protein